MKFLDKLNVDSDDEEVELKPDSRLQKEVASRTRSTETTESSDRDETALLPGAVDNSNTSSTSSTSSTETRTRNNDGDLEEQIQTVIDQNERIIELLETISSVSSGADERASSGNDELW